MNNRFLGVSALLGAPFLYIGFYLESQIKHLENSWFTGLWGLIYMLGWMVSVVGLQRMEAAGSRRFGKAILWTVLGTLTIANVSNVYQIVSPGEKSSFFFILDSFWPISNLLMIPVGVMVLLARQVTGWQRFMPLLVGGWFPFCVATMAVLGRTSVTMQLGGFYSAIAWALLGYVVYTGKTQPKKRWVVEVLQERAVG
ncbi:hypothetical protein GCM10027347_26480 [Larkinella harenae]